MLNSKKTKSKKENFYIGVDVGGTAIKFGVFKGKDDKGKTHNAHKEKLLIDKFSIDTVIDKKNTEKNLINSIFDAIEKYCSNNKYAVDKKNIVGIGITMPGPVVDNIVFRAVNINWKKEYDIVKATKKRFGEKVNVCVLNDANAAALGEYGKTLKGKCNSMALITLGTAIGTGIIINGKLMEGRTGIAGELSHIRLDYSDNAMKCNCGNVGCIETLAGSKGLINVYKRIIGQTDIDITAKTIIKSAKAGDENAYKALNISLDYVSRLIAILMHVFEPDVILIGGGFSLAGTFITKMIEKNLKTKVFMTKRLPKIMIAKLRNDAGIIGAVNNL